MWPYCPRLDPLPQHIDFAPAPSRYISPALSISWQHPAPMPSITSSRDPNASTFAAATFSVVLANSMPAGLSAETCVVPIASSASPSSWALLWRPCRPRPQARCSGSSGKTGVSPDNDNTPPGSSRASAYGLGDSKGSRRGSSVVHRSVVALPHQWGLGSTQADGAQGIPQPQLVVASSPHRSLVLG